MNASKTLIAVLALAAVGGLGYVAGRGSPAVSPGLSAAGSAASAVAAPKARKLLYYRNPMGLDDKSPVPKKDQMGMDYIAVYDGEDEEQAQPGTPGGAGQIRISTEKVQKLGVRTEAASRRLLGRTVRASGRVEPDERRMATIAPRFEGYVERLHVNVTGQPVTRGEPLFEVYSPELVSAQREYAIAMQGVQAMKAAGGEAQAGMKQLAESALARLRNWDLSAEQVEALVRTGEVRRTVTFRSPVSGIVTEKKALQGMRFMPGEALYQVTDLSSVWVMADVFEQDLALVKPGARARVRLNAYPNQVFDGTVTYIYPTLKAETRTVPVRIELANPRQLLKPAMFAQVDLQVGSQKPVLTIPDSAVIDSGTRRIVLVQLAEGRFEPREVKLGERGEHYDEVLEGVGEGEKVVVAANFLLDAESNLKAAIGGLGGAAAAPSAGRAPGAVGHKAQGTVDALDAAAGTVTLHHGAVETLQWPAMTMDFKVANAALLKDLKPGVAVSFEFVERKPGEWVVTSLTPAGAAAAAPPAKDGATPMPAPAPAPKSGHAGH
ncbi:Efflux transporter periplasmic adaptor subunit [Rubrivivax sp. A210]|uniref:efflux RND transporter periplasmic adaptor subunit n=1 Tax=Rubrivivax sp. A210 TaxID=2772301 RepID=UPI0019840045|nr:efflux RND transporter periplasmic adaptor subunit [Rubrivivax sp. A210]CAD5375182.1 Efflux transporter periplasmic adaptor subunit [Rubrivivax sp. A210]